MQQGSIQLEDLVTSNVSDSLNTFLEDRCREYCTFCIRTTII